MSDYEQYKPDENTTIVVTIYTRGGESENIRLASEEDLTVGKDLLQVTTTHTYVSPVDNQVAVTKKTATFYNFDGYILTTTTRFKGEK